MRSKRQNQKTITVWLSYTWTGRIKWDNKYINLPQYLRIPKIKLWLKHLLNWIFKKNWTHEKAYYTPRGSGYNEWFGYLKRKQKIPLNTKPNCGRIGFKTLKWTNPILAMNCPPKLTVFQCIKDIFQWLIIKKIIMALQ